MRKVIFLTLLLGACASPNLNYLPETIAISEPPVGQTVSVRIGDTLVRQGSFTKVAAIKVEAPISLGALGSYTIGTGYYLKQGEDHSSEYFEPEGGPEGGRVTKTAISDPFQSVQVMKDEQKLCGVSIFNMHFCQDNAAFTRTERHTLSSNSFQQELIYNGRVGYKLRIGYREFSDSMARQAFSNEVEYDLSTSPVIAYKGAKIEVIEATNEDIKFKVISNFNTTP